MHQLPPEIKVVTYNCWGLLHLSKHRRERLAYIAQQIAVAQPAPHIVALQECWAQEDYHLIRREVHTTLPYGKFYFSGVIGSGLVILSKWPIEESMMYRFPLGGRPTAFFRTDWLAGKGVACAKIRYGVRDKDVVEMFNAHIHARHTSPFQSDSYAVHRLSQSWELAKLIRGASERGHLVLALGGLNDIPESLPYRIVCALTSVRDVWRVMHPDSSLGSSDDDLERARTRPVPTAIANVADNGATSHSKLNTWAWPRAERKAFERDQRLNPVEAGTVDEHGRRIDYVLASGGPMPHFGGAGWVVKDVRVGMMDHPPDLHCSASDHFSVEATLALHAPPKKPLPDGALDGGDNSAPEDQAICISNLKRHVLGGGAYLQSPTGSERTTGRPRDPRRRPSFDGQLRAGGVPSDGLPASTYDEMLGLVEAYIRREQRQRRWRAAHAAFWAATLFSFHVGVWYVPPGGAFAMLLVSTLGLLAAAADGAMALLFFTAELRALQEFQWELLNARASARGSVGLSHEAEEESIASSRPGTRMKA